VIRRLLKACLYGIAQAAAFPWALASGFGRVKPIYTLCSHCFALAPGAAGDYLRGGYYSLTLREFSMTSRISFGSFFAHPEARVGSSVYIGSYCILGKVVIGKGTQIASSVQVLSGQHQHARNSSGEVFHPGEFVMVNIGSDCWLGAASIVMADVGDRTTIGAGSVVTRAIPADSVAVGSPARVISGGPQIGEADLPATAKR
jgi:virginiamycin A acetyltransferase